MSIVIIGCGFAGASFAWWLARYGVRDITILEREEMPGTHSSGLNAGMTRGFDENEKIAHFAWEGAEFIRNPPEGFSETKLIDVNGSLLLGRKNRFEDGFRPEGSKIISKEEAAKIVPYLKDAKFEAALWSPNDGVVDIHSYLWAYINGAKAKGVKLITNCEVKSIKVIALARRQFGGREHPRPKQSPESNCIREIASLTLAMTD
ncbi:MAG: FAD-binding oxidoreductase, partial [Deltaproteobacteria bacterium]|nr:FAD-binding oxidoreductase [Deltaproteobacteria bacterium]